MSSQVTMKALDYGDPPTPSRVLCALWGWGHLVPRSIPVSLLEPPLLQARVQGEGAVETPA